MARMAMSPAISITLQEDIPIMKRLNIRASLSLHAACSANGTGQVIRGLDYYTVSPCVAGSGIRFLHDLSLELPQALEDKEAWPNRHWPALCDFAAITGQESRRRNHVWAPFNMPSTLPATYGRLGASIQIKLHQFLKARTPQSAQGMASAATSSLLEGNRGQRYGMRPGLSQDQQ